MNRKPLLNQRKTLGIYLLGILLMIAGCKQETADNSIPALEAKFKAVTANTGEAPNTEEIKEVMKSLAGAYEKFAADKPQDPQAPEYLYKAAELYETNMMDIAKAMGIFDKIIQDFPENERAADALFKKGYVYHNTLKDLPKARDAYMTFIEKYPDHELVNSAKFEIENLGVSAKDLLERIQQNTDSTEQAPI